jgi:hypothetical protein
MPHITLSIDVTQIQKARLKPFTKKDGSKAVYCELILIETPNGQYGDFMVKQHVTKEERAARLEMPILGNAKYLGGSGDTNRGGKTAPSPRSASPGRNPETSATPPEDDDCPF